jgi:undecaprenyl-diphosphatase
MSEIDVLQAIVLGFIQGATEFLPVSSSAHLVLFQEMLGLKNPELFFDVVLHGATMIVVCLVYAKDLYEIARQILLALGDIRSGESPRTVWRKRPYLRLAAFLVVATVPAGLAGLMFKHPLEELFGSPVSASAMLLVTGTILFLTRKRTAPGRSLEAFTLRDSIVVGIGQSIALLPGISRSGTTIATGIFCGVDRDLAARFSFLLSVPAILGANLLEILEIRNGFQEASLLPFLAGGVTALATGYLALKLLLRIVHRGNISLFSYYCWTVGLVALSFFWIHASG